MIQIGMNCDPEWLCDTITWIIAALLALLVIGLIRITLRERRKSNKKYRIKPRNRRANRDDH
ncbi:hypothetical protein [Saccharospirillum alexandrii]|uniref:hypothetical protein n=1 Tax=Saccharospirillum alexandrii TaxID=2448477 RepID=UPI003735C862